MRRVHQSQMIDSRRLFLFFVSVCFLHEVPCREMKTECAVNAVVTAASSDYFEAVLNMVGSVHIYETGMPILIYDLGLSHRHLQVAQYIADSTVIPFPFWQHPPHVRNLKNYAWKACVIRDAVELMGCVLFLDAGMEVRSDLTDLKMKLAVHGAWFVSAPHELSPLHNWVHPNTYKAMGIDESTAFSSEGIPLPSIATGMMGWCRYSRLWEDVFSPWLNCSVTPSCISPAGTYKPRV